MNKHTPGPWKTGISITATSIIYGPDDDRLGGMELPVNGERACACVNACEGINPEAVPDLLAAYDMAERALRHAAQESKGRVKAELVGGWLYHANQARAAIAKAKEVRS